jgi:glycosyltransferase involved in cell wall biosynthesis
MTALYICYQSIREPLTETQVVAYLEGLAAAGHTMLLLTFERAAIDSAEGRTLADRLLSKGIRWHWLHYHKRPTAPATAWDIAMGVLYGLWLARWQKIDLFHARAHVAGLMGLILRTLTGARLLFDVRGLLAEEYADAGLWPRDGRLFRLTKFFERLILGHSDGIIVLTHRGRSLLAEWYPEEIAGTPLAVIPCCVDRERAARSPVQPAPLQPVHGRPFPTVHAVRPLTLVYVGKLGGLYMTAAILQFFSFVKQLAPGSRFEIWTQSDRGPLAKRLEDHGLAADTLVGCSSPAELLLRLESRCDAAVSFIRPCVSKLASSPTKIPEYLAAGLPVVANGGIGDMDELIAQEGVGVTVADFSDESLRSGVRQLIDLLADQDVRSRCRNAAEKYFDLERVGWSGYCGMYQQIERG